MARLTAHRRPWRRRFFTADHGPQIDSQDALVVANWAWVVLFDVRSAVKLPEAYWERFGRHIGSPARHVIHGDPTDSPVGGQTCGFAVGFRPDVSDPVNVVRRRLRETVALKEFHFYNMTITAGPTLFRQTEDGLKLP